jgi:hypothetical protein
MTEIQELVMEGLEVGGAGMIWRVSEKNMRDGM